VSPRIPATRSRPAVAGGRRAASSVCRGLLLLALLSAAAAAQSLYEREKIVPRPDYDKGVVYLERWRGDYFLGVERVVPLDEYLEYQIGDSYLENWREKARREGEKRQLATDASGLIPDIELPKLPIFGEGSRIDISGRDRITLGGRQTFQRGTYREGTGGLLPELKLEQQLAVTLNGSIGDRTKVNIDHDSEREEAKNKVKLTYTGTEDEIVQSVELGDTRLSIPGTGYTGDLPAFQGLFGASAKGKLAGVDVYAIASREESQSQSQSFQGKRRVFMDTLRDDRYVTRRFYQIPVSGTFKTLRIYVDDKNPLNNNATQRGIATTLLDYPDSVPGRWNYDRAAGDFDLKTLGRDYFVHPGNVIEFASSLEANDVAGFVAYTATESLGGFNWRDSLVVAMLKPELSDSLSQTWDYELRNVYALPQTDVTLKSLRVYLDLPSGQDPETDTAGANLGVKFTQILGLDPDGDGLIQYPEFQPSSGLIRFPGRRPFDSTALSVRDRMIYRKDPYQLQAGEGRFYYMVVEYSSAAGSYYLGQPDITDGSEKVTVSGQQWTRGTDYTIDYKAGVISFIRQLPADADIRVTYEYRPLFSIAQKAVLGTRAEMPLGQRGKVGASVFYRSEGTGEEKPVLGSEPFTRTIAEADASYSLSSDAAAAFLDRLPLLRAQAPVTASASAEGAVSFPDPNTRGSAWLDDFQGTSIRRSIVLSSILWSFSSVPASRDTNRFARVPLRWSNPPFRADTFAGPYSSDDPELEDEVPTLMRVLFDPSADSDAWAGMMTNAAQIGMNLRDVENMQLVLKTRRPRGIIHVTAGMSIDEDAPRRNRAGRIVGYDGVLNTEDRDNNGQLQDFIEDTGLDTIAQADSLYGGADTLDDGNDDYDPDTNPNGTEGNNRMDSEDLDRNGFSRYNHYFECAVELGDPRFFTSLRNGWQLCRVSLHDTLLFRVTGSPKWEDIKTVRVWFEGFDGPDTIDLYSLEFTGSSWINPTVGPLNPTRIIPVDTTEKIWVTEVSKKTDTSYVPPVEPKRDAQGRYTIDPGLLFGYQNLYGNRRALASKTATDRDDYRDYTDVKIYVHDDGNDLGWVLRLGSDTSNFYEYAAPITSGDLVPGRDGRWYEFTVALESFPLLKPARDSSGRSGTWGTGRYRVRGSPSLSDVRYTALGLDNPSTRKLSGGIWFDELRLAGARKEPGYGFQTRAALALSDFASVSVSYSYSDPNFRRFSEGRGVKTGGYGTNVGLNTQVNFDRLLPQNWGLVIPFSYVTSRLSDLPKFSASYPDLRLDRATAGDQRSSGWSEEMALDNVRKQRSSSQVMNYTLEAMGLSYRQRRAASQALLARDSSWARTMQWSWGVSPDVKIDLRGDQELALVPQGIRYGIANAQNLNLRGTRLRADSAFRYDTLRGNGLNTDFSVEYSPLEDLSFDFSDESERDLVVPNPDSLLFLKIGSEAGRDHSFGASYNIEFGDWLSPGIDYSGEYSDERPKAGAQYADYRNMTNSGDLDVSLGLDLPELLGMVKQPKPSPKPVPAKPPVAPKDSGAAPGSDSTPAPTPAPVQPAPQLRPIDGLRRAANFLSKSLEPIDASYSISRGSDILGTADNAPWHYRLGFSDVFPFDSTRPPSSATRELRNGVRLSSGARISELTARLGFDWSEGRNVSGLLNSTVLDRSSTWPDVQLTLGKVHNAFKKYATDSKLSTTYRRRYDLGGTLLPLEQGDTLGMIGRSEQLTTDLNPLLSWQTTWKKKVSSTLSANYSISERTNFLSDDGLRRNVTDTRTRGGNLSVSYSFSAPQGIKLPLLRNLKFTSDLTLNATMRYANTVGKLIQWDTLGVPNDTTDLSDDNSFGATLAASYRFSRSIEAGLSSGYSRSKGLTPVTTETVDLDLWVLFRF
jgi:hypothetical protein